MIVKNAHQFFMVEFNQRHSRSQRLRSFWSAPGIETSGRLQHLKSAIHGLIAKSDKSDWLKITERVLYACSEIGSDQRSQSLAQTRRIVGSGDENESENDSLTVMVLNKTFVASHKCNATM